MCVASIIFNLGFLPNKYAGNKCEANSDLVCLGGIFIIKRFNLPLAISSKAFAIFTWWSPVINSFQIDVTKSIKVLVDFS